MTTDSPFGLLRTQRFFPLFLTQALGAFNDNLYKQALIILITYRLAGMVAMPAGILVAVASSLFVLPYFMFSAIAGQMADKYEKSKLIRQVKLAEIIIMLLASLALFMNNLWALLFIIFLLGIQATFFSPLKYGILPDHLKESELIPANSMIEAATFLMILIGTIFGQEIILLDHGVYFVTGGLIGIAVLGWIASAGIPKAPPAEPDLEINLALNPKDWALHPIRTFRSTATWGMIKFSTHNQSIFRSILGISWFWLVGIVFLTQIPVFAKNVIGGTHSVATLFLTLFSVGIGIGSMACNRLLKHRIEATYVPFAAIVMTIFIIDLYFASRGLVGLSYYRADEVTVREFLTKFSSWHILLDMLIISFCAGVYIVPLYAILQSRSEKSHRSRVIAANNIINAAFMVGGSILSGVLIGMHISIPGVFLIVGLANAVVAIYICTLLPDAVVKSLMRWTLSTCFGVKVEGLQHYDNASGRTLIIANHTSFLDAALIAAYLPDKITFAVNTHIAKRWWLRPFLALVDAFPLDPTNPLATKALIEKLRKGGKVMIFPEGRITVTGSLMKIYEGPGMIADKADAMLLPIRIEGAQYTHFSRLRGKVRLRLFPRITLTLLEPRRFHVDDSIKGRKRRNLIGNRLYDVMTEMMFESSHRHETLFTSLIDAMSLHGGKHVILDDIQRQPITYRQLITRSFVLGREMATETVYGEKVGLLLPNMVTTAVSFFALHAVGRVPAMLNFSTGSQNLVLACHAAQIQRVYTSRRFIETARLEDAIAALQNADVTISYLEDFPARLTTGKKLRGLLMGYMPRRSYRRLLSKTPSSLVGEGRDGGYGRTVSAEDGTKQSWIGKELQDIKRVAGIKPKSKRPMDDLPDSAAVILFTSGSEGTPKGVALSHANLQANRYQLAAKLDFGPQDIVFNALPVFHSFGLTGGLILPILSGIRIFLYPSPLHYRIVPELVYDTNATIMFGTDTFLSGYARFAHPYDFYNLRLVIAGAERVKEETRRVWTDKFGVRILEGYGTTETAPALALNTPMQNKQATVGRLLPGVQTYLEAVPGITDGARLYVTGPNIMMGYYKSDQPGVLTLSVDAPNAMSPYPWHDTGDIVSFDDEGYMSIRGRAKRFAKIGGEMVSLAAVETYLSDLWPGSVHAVVSIPDERKGEQLVLVTNFANAQRDDIIGYTRYHGISELAIPRTIHIVDQVPLLGTGKVDYGKVREIAGQ